MTEGWLSVSTYSLQFFVCLLEWVAFSRHNARAVIPCLDVSSTRKRNRLSVEGSHPPLGTNLLWEDSKSTHCSKGLFWCSSTSQEWLHPLTRQFLIVLLLCRLYNIFKRHHRYPNKPLCLIFCNKYSANIIPDLWDPLFWFWLFISLLAWLAESKCQMPGHFVCKSFSLNFWLVRSCFVYMVPLAPW